MNKVTVIFLVMLALVIGSTSVYARPIEGESNPVLDFEWPDDDLPVTTGNTYVCQGEEDGFTEFMSAWNKVADSANYSLYRADEYRDVGKTLSKIQEPSCMTEWKNKKLEEIEMMADTLEEVFPNGMIDSSTRSTLILMDMYYEIFKDDAYFTNTVNDARIHINEEDLPLYDEFHVGMYDGQSSSANFEVGERCDDLQAMWMAHQGNNGGYVHIELVNYNTGESQNIANKVLQLQFGYPEIRTIKNLDAGTYFVRSNTYPKWAVQLLCEN